MTTDYEAIQGKWRLVSSMTLGAPVDHPATHYVFEGNRFYEIVPDLPDDGKLRSTFELSTRWRRRCIVITHDYNGPDGPPDPAPIIERGLYSIEGNTLKLCWGPEGRYPRAISGKKDALVVLERQR